MDAIRSYIDKKGVVHSNVSIWYYFSEDGSVRVCTEEEAKSAQSKFRVRRKLLKSKNKKQHEIKLH